MQEYQFSGCFEHKTKRPLNSDDSLKFAEAITDFAENNGFLVASSCGPAQEDPPESFMKEIGQLLLDTISSGAVEMYSVDIRDRAIVLYKQYKEFRK